MERNTARIYFEKLLFAFVWTQSKFFDNYSGADVNQYVTHSVVVNGKIYQDDGSYAEATNRLLDKQ